MILIIKKDETRRSEHVNHVCVKTLEDILENTEQSFQNKNIFKCNLYLTRPPTGQSCCQNRIWPRIWVPSTDYSQWLKQKTWRFSYPSLSNSWQQTTNMLIVRGMYCKMKMFAKLRFCGLEVNMPTMNCDIHGSNPADNLCCTSSSFLSLVSQRGQKSSNTLSDKRISAFFLLHAPIGEDVLGIPALLSLWFLLSLYHDSSREMKDEGISNKRHEMASKYLKTK